MFVARWPLLVIIFSLVISVGLSVGIMNIDIQTQPEKLWVPKNSKTAQAKEYFDNTFGPFYRIEQIIVTQNTNPEGNAEVNGQPFNMITLNNLVNMLTLQQNITGLTANYTDPSTNQTTVVSLNDICYKPIAVRFKSIPAIHPLVSIYLIF